LIGDTLAQHVQLTTGGWIQAGDSTAGLFFGQTGSTFALIGRGGGRTHFAVRAADGAATFGYNRLDADGFETQVAGSYADEQSLRFVDTARVRLSRLAAYYTASWNALRLQVSERAACSSELNLLAESAEGLEALVTTTATNNLYDVSMDVRVGPTGGSIDLKTPKARVQGGLYVGTLVGQTGSFNLGDIWATGRISAATGMVALQDGGVRVYAATGSDAGTRGVSFRQNITGGDVQSGYIGARSSLSESTQYWKALGATGQDAALYLEAAGGRANARQSEGRLSFVATGYTGGTAKSAQMALVGRPDGKSVIYCEPAGGFFGIGEGGLLVGACGETTDVPAGEIWADGLLSSAGGLAVLGATGAVFQAVTGTNPLRGLRWIAGGTGLAYVGSSYALHEVNTYWGIVGLTGRDSYLALESYAPIDRVSQVTLKAGAANEGVVTVSAGPTGARVSVSAPEVEIAGGVVVADEVGAYAPPSPGMLKALYGVAAGSSNKFWELGGYTGQTATATGHVWVKIDGVLRKLLAA
jgi:hypothetical protein